MRVWAVNRGVKVCDVVVGGGWARRVWFGACGADAGVSRVAGGGVKGGVDEV